MGTEPDFYMAPFAAEGELLGVVAKSRASLSPKWLEFFEQLLEVHGVNFRCEMPLPPLAHISVKVTSAKQAALVTWSVGSVVASSSIALSGGHAGAEAEVTQLFIDSLRRVAVVQQTTTSSTPFEELTMLTQRPLYVVVPWGESTISDQDYDLVSELEIHLAAALLARLERDGS